MCGGGGGHSVWRRRTQCVEEEEKDTECGGGGGETLSLANSLVVDGIDIILQIPTGEEFHQHHFLH